MFHPYPRFLFCISARISLHKPFVSFAFSSNHITTQLCARFFQIIKRHRLIYWNLVSVCVRMFWAPFVCTPLHRKVTIPVAGKPRLASRSLLLWRPLINFVPVMASENSFFSDGEWTLQSTFSLNGIPIPTNFTPDPAALQDYVANFQTRHDDVFIVSFPKSGKKLFW